MKSIVVIFLISLIAVPMVAYKIANHVKFLQEIFCKIGWHSHQYDLVATYENDPYGTSNKYQCKWCKEIGLVDSQGNLF